MSYNASENTRSILFPGFFARTSLKHRTGMCVPYFRHHLFPGFFARTSLKHRAYQSNPRAKPPFSGLLCPDLIEAPARPVVCCCLAPLFPGFFARTSLKQGNLSSLVHEVFNTLFPGFFARTSLKR